MMVFANILGTMANEVLPEGFIMIFLIIVFFIGILANIRGAVKRYQLETQKMRAANSPDRTKNMDIELKESLISRISNLPRPELPERMEMDAVEKEAVDRLKHYESRNFHPLKTPIFVATIAFTIIYFLFRGSESLPSVLGLPKCHWVQNVVLGITLVGILAIQFFSVRIVKQEQAMKLKHNLHQPHEVFFTNEKILFLISFATVIGFLTNLLGIGGGFVIFPMLTSMGISPLVASASTLFMIFLSKVVAVLLAVLSPNLKIDYTVLTVISVCSSVILFAYLADVIMQR